MNKELTAKADLDLGSRSINARASTSCLDVVIGTDGQETI